MLLLQESLIARPYCVEHMTALVDTQEGASEYIEDCLVCCCPIVFHINARPEGGLKVRVRTEGYPLRRP